jgi:hypothetical protein
MVLAAEFGIATLLITAGSLLRIRGYLAAAVGTSLLLVPGYGAWVTTQCADVAVGLYIVMAIALMSEPQDSPRLALAGVALGLAAWTKNEGVVAMLVVTVSFVALRAARTDLRDLAKPLTSMACGLVVVLIGLIAFKALIAPPSDFAAGMGTNPGARFFDFERQRTVATFMLTHLGEWGDWRVFSPTWLVVGWALMGLRAVPRRLDASLGVATVLLMLASYYMVYVLTTQPLVWQMQVSWDRLVSQVWPTMAWTAAAMGLSVWTGETRNRTHKE